MGAPYMAASMMGDIRSAQTQYGGLGWAFQQNVLAAQQQSQWNHVNMLRPKLPVAVAKCGYCGRKAKSDGQGQCVSCGAPEGE